MDPNPPRVFLSFTPPGPPPGDASFDRTEEVLTGLLTDAEFHVESRQTAAGAGPDALVRIDDRIRHSDFVLQFAGSGSSEPVPAEAVMELLQRLDAERRPFAIGQPGDFRLALGDFSGFTFADWEAFLALHHRVPLSRYAPRNPAESGHAEFLALADPPCYTEFCRDLPDLSKKVLHRLQTDLPGKPVLPPAQYNPRPALTVGIVGEMHLPEAGREKIREQIRNVFRWLGKAPFPGNKKEFGEALKLKKTPVVLLSSLAPGADQLGAEVALEEGIQVKCPLPFPHHLYRRSTTFVDDGEKTATVARQAVYDDLISRIGPENVFPVSRAGDDLPDQPPLEEQVGDRVGRNLRYRAAGDYIAANCDILIAVCDQESPQDEPAPDPELPSLAQCGTRVIVHSYLNGIRPGVLPIPPSLSWQESGPLIRIFCPSDPEREDPRTGEVAIWPADDPSEEDGEEGRLHEQVMGDLRLKAKRLENLNDDLDRSPKEEHDPEIMFEEAETFRPLNSWERLLQFLSLYHLKRRIARYWSFLPWVPNDDVEISLPPLERLVSFLRRTEFAVKRYDNQVSVLTNAPFVMGPLVYLILAYHQSLSGEEPEFRDAAQFRAVVSFALAAGIILSAFLIHWWAKSWHAFDRKNDYRALIEGIRVQFYWAAAGITDAVPRNYQQRLRGELSWIQSAIRSLTLPLNRIAGQFHTLGGHEEKCERLRKIWTGWVRSQEQYFAREGYHQTFLNTRLRFLGNMFLSAGAAMLFISFAHDWLWGTAVYRIIETSFSLLRGHGLPIWFLLVIFLHYFLQWLASRAHRIFNEAGDTGHPVVRTVKTMRRLDNQFLRILVGASLGFVVYSAIHDWFLRELAVGIYADRPHSGFHLHLPSPGHHGNMGELYHSLLGLFRNIFFAVGGLLLTYSLVKFTRENSRRYASMRRLHRAAGQKIGRLIDHYEELIAAGAPEEELLRAQQSIRELYVSLGREALHEHTEWLMMRRNRPVEPVVRVA